MDRLKDVKILRDPSGSRFRVSSTVSRVEMIGTADKDGRRVRVEICHLSPSRYVAWKV